MRTAFSDSQDKKLVQLASVYERRGVRITWKDVHMRMRCSRHSLVDLRERLHTLMRKYGPKLSRFPCRLFTPTRRASLASRPAHHDPSASTEHIHASPPPLQPEQVSIGTGLVSVTTHILGLASSVATPAVTPVLQAAQDVSEVENGSVLLPTHQGDADSGGGNHLQHSTLMFSTQRLQVADSSESHARVLVSCDEVPLSAELAMQSVEDLFACVRKVDVRQKPGQRHLNAGELLPAGVDKLIKTLGDVEASDSFLDIGCGLGNVTMQFALQTPAKSCLGIEIRPDIFYYGWRLIQNSVEHQRHLKKVTLVCGDASNLCLASEKPFNTATIVLANNRLFEETAKLKIQEQLGIHSYARIVVFGENASTFMPPFILHKMVRLEGDPCLGQLDVEC
ncbi:hypothetical protein DVH05_020455 [Phytophthora capsici]|nr:hypothetical protein DVH05_020455 [Phytophthora capsici]